MDSPVKFPRKIVRSILLIATAAAAASLSQMAPGIAANTPIVIEGSQGYGLDARACSEVGYDCERIVADSWCEARGRVRSLSIVRLAPVGAGDVSRDDRFSIICE